MPKPSQREIDQSMHDFGDDAAEENEVSMHKVKERVILDFEEKIDEGCPWSFMRVVDDLIPDYNEDDEWDG